MFNPASNKCVEISGASTSNGARAVLQTCSGARVQRFSTTDTADGFFRFQNLNSTKCLDVAGNTSDDGLVVQQWTCADIFDQRWAPRFP